MVETAESLREYLAENRSPEERIAAADNPGQFLDARERNRQEEVKSGINAALADETQTDGVSIGFTERGLADDEITESIAPAQSEEYKAAKEALSAPAKTAEEIPSNATTVPDEQVTEVDGKVDPTPETINEISTGLPDADKYADVSPTGERKPGAVESTAANISAGQASEAEVAAAAEATNTPKNTVTRVNARNGSVNEAAREGKHDALMISIQDMIEAPQKRTLPNGSTTFGDNSRAARNKADLASQLLAGLGEEGLRNLSKEELEALERAFARAGRYDMSSLKAGKLIDAFIENVNDEIELSSNYDKTLNETAARETAQLDARRAERTVDVNADAADAALTAAEAATAESLQRSEAMMGLIKDNKIKEATELEWESRIANSQRMVDEAYELGANREQRVELEQLQLQAGVLKTMADKGTLEINAEATEATVAYLNDPESAKTQQAFMEAHTKAKAYGDILESLNGEDEEKAEKTYNAALDTLNRLQSTIALRSQGAQAQATKDAQQMLDNGLLSQENFNTKVKTLTEEYATAAGIPNLQTLFKEENERVKKDILPRLRSTSFADTKKAYEAFYNPKASGDAQISLAPTAQEGLAPESQEGSPAAPAAETAADETIPAEDETLPAEDETIPSAEPVAPEKPAQSELEQFAESVGLTPDEMRMSLASARARFGQNSAKTRAIENAKEFSKLTRDRKTLQSQIEKIRSESGSVLLGSQRKRINNIQTKISGLERKLNKLKR